MPVTTARKINDDDRTNKLIQRVELLRRLRNALNSKKALLAEARAEYEVAEKEFNEATLRDAKELVS